MSFEITTPFGRPLSGYQADVQNYLMKGSTFSAVWGYLRALPLLTYVKMTFSAVAITAPFFVRTLPLAGKIVSVASALFAVRSIIHEGNPRFHLERKMQENTLALVELLGGAEVFSKLPRTAFFKEVEHHNLAKVLGFEPEAPIMVGVDKLQRPFVVFALQLKPGCENQYGLDHSYWILQQRYVDHSVWVINSSLEAPNVHVDGVNLRNNGWISELLSGKNSRYLLATASPARV